MLVAPSVRLSVFLVQTANVLEPRVALDLPIQTGGDLLAPPLLQNRLICQQWRQNGGLRAAGTRSPCEEGRGWVTDRWRYKLLLVLGWLSSART